uniref:HAT C-terminal dimerisation domain-containing protein n=1 Tax=Mycena chlorophos TaxID=658473 RepID=A0ABQ0MAQ6_MYCCL|nr:predicted protein [Mycena chlorophos]
MQNLAKFKQAVRLRAAKDKRKPHPLDVYDTFTIPGHDTEDPPLVRIAKRVLSITANSASCERLFSVFSATLTKLRNHLATTTLSNLAELKMLIRDEHVRKGNAKNRLRRKFAQAASEPVSAPAPTAPVPAANSADAEYEPEPEPEANPEPGSTTPVPTSEFEALTEKLAEAVDNDEDPAADALPHPGNKHISITIHDLFNFDALQTWIQEHETHAQNALDEETALYELVDTGATVEDTTVEVDATAAAVLDMN